MLLGLSSIRSSGQTPDVNGSWLKDNTYTSFRKRLSFAARRSPPEALRREFSASRAALPPTRLFPYRQLWLGRLYWISPETILALRSGNNREVKIDERNEEPPAAVIRIVHPANAYRK